MIQIWHETIGRISVYKCDGKCKYKYAIYIYIYELNNLIKLDEEKEDSLLCNQIFELAFC